jgi:hypothetical protein
MCNTMRFSQLSGRSRAADIGSKGVRVEEHGNMLRINVEGLDHDDVFGLKGEMVVLDSNDIFTVSSATAFTSIDEVIVILSKKASRPLYPAFSSTGETVKGRPGSRVAREISGSASCLRGNHACARASPAIKLHSCCTMCYISDQLSQGLLLPHHDADEQHDKELGAASCDWSEAEATDLRMSSLFSAKLIPDVRVFC